MTTPNPRGAGTQRNPGPRPALRREGGASDGALVVARPGTGVPGKDTDSSPARIAVVPAKGPRPQAPAQSADEGKRPRDSKNKGAKKKDKRSRKKDKRSKKDKTKGEQSNPAISDLVPSELTVPLPKPLRRALAQAAAERDVAPELLVAQVLSEWLDH